MAARGIVLRILAAVFSWLIPEGLRVVPELRGGYACGLAYSDCRGDCPQAPVHDAPAAVNGTTDRAAHAANPGEEEKADARARTHGQ